MQVMLASGGLRERKEIWAMWVQLVPGDFLARMVCQAYQVNQVNRDTPENQANLPQMNIF